MVKNSTDKNKNIHTNPDKAGKQNFEGKKLPKAGDPTLLPRILKLGESGSKYNQQYKGKWTADELRQSIAEFFNCCADLDIKPTNVALCIWLGISKSQYYDWKCNRTGTYTDKSELIRQADLFFEAYLLGDIDTHTVGSIFLLKCKHDYVEKTQVDVTSNGNSVSDADEVRDLVAKMGLDKQSK